MVFVPRQVAYASLLDSAGRVASFESYVSAAQARLFAAELTEAGANGTLVGDLLTTAAALSGAAVREKGVRIFFFDEDAVKPSAETEFLRGNKIVVGFRGSGRAFVRTIPARNPAAYTMAADGITVNIEADPAPSGAFVAAFNAVALDINGAVATVEKLTLND